MHSSRQGHMFVGSWLATSTQRDDIICCLLCRCIADRFLTQPPLCGYCTYCVDAINLRLGSSALTVDYIVSAIWNQLTENPPRVQARGGAPEKEDGRCVFVREAAVEISGEKEKQERNKSHHLSCILLRNFCPFVTFINSFVLWEGDSIKAYLYLLNSQFPDGAKMARKRIPFPLFNIIFQSNSE